MTTNWYKIGPSGDEQCLAFCGSSETYRVYKTSQGHSVYRKMSKSWSLLKTFHSASAAKFYVEGRR